MRELWTWSVIAALVMGVLVWGLTFWAVIFHRKKKDSPEFPRQTAYNVPLELAYTAVPFVIIAVLFYFTVIVQNHVLEKEDNPQRGGGCHCVPVELEVRLPLHRPR